MLSPNPFSLFCAVLLCLPLALVFTTAPTTAPPSVAVNVPIPRRVTVKRNFISRKTQFDPLQEITPPPKPISQFPPNPPQYPRSDELNSTVPPPPTSPPPPELPPDDKDDLALFRRASHVNPNHSPAHAPRKIAFLFLTTTPLPFARLWERFFKGNRNFNIYVHADPTREYSPPFSGHFSGKVIPSSKPTRRNSPTLATAARRLLSHALLDDPTNHIFTLLSASCIPLHSFAFTYKTLASSKKSFIEILKNETGAWDRWTARGTEMMLPEVPFDDFRIGSQFWALTRRHARMVARDVRLWKKFRLPCVEADTCYPEENYFPTLMSTVGARGVVPATLTHVDWSGSYDGHPKTYNSSEVDAKLIQRLRSEKPRYGDFGSNGSDVSGSGVGRNDPFLFARKFKPECLGPLLNISGDVIFSD